LTVEVRNADERLVDFDLEAVALNTDTGEPNCTEITKVLITTGSRIVFQFSGCIVARTSSSISTTPTSTTTTPKSTTGTTSPQGTPSYQWYGQSTNYAQSHVIYTY